jgi:hypothetical protein
LDELQWKTKKYHERKPYRFFTVPTIDGQNLFKVQVTTDPPPELACIAFDAINCLRSSLDHAVFASTCVLTGHENPNSTKFPFADKADDLAGEWSRGASGVPKDLRPFLVNLKPFQNGNNLLWGLNKVRNSKIHRVLAPTVSVPAGTAMNAVPGPVGLHIHIWEPIREWNEERREFTYGRGRVSGFGTIAVQIELAFTQKSALGSRLVGPTLRQTAGIVEGIVSGLEAETARIIRLRS